MTRTNSDASETALGVEAERLRSEQAGIPRRFLSALHTVGRPGLQRLSSGDPTFPQPCAICSTTTNVGLSSRTGDWRCGRHLYDEP